MNCFKGMVWPAMEYGATVWFPHQQYLSDSPEKRQETFGMSLLAGLQCYRQSLCTCSGIDVGHSEKPADSFLCRYAVQGHGWPG